MEAEAIRLKKIEEDAMRLKKKIRRRATYSLSVKNT